jgi:hypothetical protein
LSGRRRRVPLALAVVASVVGTGLPFPPRAGATVDFVAATSSGSSGARPSITVTRPPGTAAGDLMLASVVVNDDDPLTAPAGWSLVRQDTVADALRQNIYVKVAGGAEPGSYTWTLPGDRRVAGGITTYSGADPADPVDVHSASTYAAPTTAVTAPSVTTTGTDTRLVHFAAVNAEGTLGAPSGMTERWEAASPRTASTRDALASSSDAPRPVAGPTGPRTATASQPGRAVGALVALRPGGPPPPPDEIPPETFIDSGPSGTVDSSSATFSFHATEANSTFACRLDGAAFSPCDSPKTYFGLANGAHTFAVFATDAAGNADTSPASRTWTVQATADPVLVGAGDIAACDTNNDEATAQLLDRIGGTVFTTGDNAYPNGTAAEFANCYGPTWGRHKGRTRPSAGNHEYNTTGATGYYGYFGAAAGDPAKGYYDYALGPWHVVVLNSNCAAVGGCGLSSPQGRWLQAVLAASTADCTVAYWHAPRFSSAVNHGSDATYQAFWQALYDAGADVVLAGHDHVYERFALQSPTGAPDPSFGIRQFTVGTGGRSLYGFRTPLPTSQFRYNASYGVLRLTLHRGAYDWQMVRTGDAAVVDSGTGACHGAPSAAPPPPPPPPPPGPITEVASASSGSSSARSSITIPRPAGTASGHVMLASIVANDDDPNFTAPAGWTLVRQDTVVDALRQNLYVKVAGGAEPSAYTWTLSGTRRVAGGVTTYSGVDTSDPVDTHGATAQASPTTAVIAPSVTTTVEDTLLVHFAAVNAEGTISAPPGMTERWEAASPKSDSTRDALCSSSDSPRPATGPTGPRTATATRAGRNIGALLALRPAERPFTSVSTPP